MKLLRSLIGILFGMIYSALATGQGTTSDELKLWFTHPAATWNEALPVGNGRLGAMVFGGVTTERLQLNESSVWTGKKADFVNPAAKGALPKIRQLLFAGKYAEAKDLAEKTMMGDKKDYATYQTLGDLNLQLTHPKGDITDYRRDLDLETAVASVRYRVGSVAFQREIFSSAPDQALVVRLTASKPGSLSFNLSLSRPGNKAKLEVKNGEITMSEHVGDGVGVRMVARLKVLNDGGEVTVNDQAISVGKANAVTLLLTAATDYRNSDPVATANTQLAAAEKRTFEAIKKDHIADYQRYFKRVDLDLGRTNAVYFPTDARLTALQNGNTDPQLIKLYYQFGRYLLISSSRPGGLPANLQGIWADGLTPPWSADYHININIQMNYWLAEATNLSEMHEPFFDFLGDLREDGRKTARDMYGISGTVAHFTTDPWHFTEPYGQTQWAMWPMGLAWSAQHVWEHYLFTGDETHLRNVAYPILKEAAEFCANWLVENPATKQLVSGPSISPENTFKTKTGEVATMVMGPTMDHMIIRDLLSNTIEASQKLNIDAAFRRRLTNTLSRLAPTRIGSDGRIMEWTEEFEEAEPGHRHISHLFGLHPGRQITKQKSPELLTAARKTIDHRLKNGGGHTGWSRAWIVNFFARLQDGEAAHDNLVALLRKSTLPNLFDNHPPFQIDGNFGAPAGITEMLLQSHADEIQLLPALPKAWPTGRISGLCARGGFEVAMEWEGGRLKQATILSKLGNAGQVRYGDQVITLPARKGATVVLDGTLKEISSKN
ncbi:glycoside hydrolase family 95 protein [Tellurirhabdus bombi]|uniref:glycoside hydrolase family 95 protein n=1 Tax=Tellurirhabdus bombi TaxID=2907205 RepID=UPI001F2C1AA5|nr:glycoside hydrolase family 95 protein [Tellurirhabdus bombi]